MTFNDFMKTIRQMDHRSNQWFVRHFYVIFFEIILVVAFIVFFVLTINTINISADIPHNDITDRILLQQNYLSLLIVFLGLLNSFWLLFMFSGLLRIRSVLKNIDFNLSRRHNDRREDDND